MGRCGMFWGLLSGFQVQGGVLVGLGGIAFVVVL